MAEEKGTASQEDMLDIIFANRNKAYGAYFLRRNYSKYLGKALATGLLLIFLFFFVFFLAFPSPFFFSRLGSLLSHSPRNVPR